MPATSFQSLYQGLCDILQVPSIPLAETGDGPAAFHIKRQGVVVPHPLRLSTAICRLLPSDRVNSSAGDPTSACDEGEAIAQREAQACSRYSPVIFMLMIVPRSA